MAYADENDIRVLTENIRDKLRVTDKTEAQALSASAQEGNYGVYYASDTKKIVVGGQKYGGSDYTLPTATDGIKGGIKVALGSIGTPADMSDNYTNAFGVSEDRLVLANATTSHGGAMSASDKAKLDITITEDNEYFDIDEYKYYSKQYLTFEVVEDGTVTILSTGSWTRNVYYSVDNGSTWSMIATSNTAFSFGNFTVGDKVLVKCTTNFFSNTGSLYVKFGGTAKTNVNGNILSLIYGDAFIGKTTIASNASYCFFSLFSGYTNLISAENFILPITDVPSNVYNQMFYNCTGLIYAPKILPATTLHDECYRAMFHTCTSLITVPELPATTLANSCYRVMFKGCTSLEKAPELPAKTLVSNCYLEMFYGCSSLNYIKALFTTTPSTSYTSNWVNGVSASGYFIKADDAEWELTGVHGVPVGWSIVKESEWIDDWEKLNTYTINNTNIIKVMYDALPYTHRYLTFRVLSDGVIGWKQGASATARTLQYSINFGEWINITSNKDEYGASFNVKDGDIIRWKGTNEEISGQGAAQSNYFITTCEFDAEGNTLSLFWGDNFMGKTTFPNLTKNACGGWMFYNCTNLINAEHITFEHLTDSGASRWGYSQAGMFYGCTSLLTSPIMPSKTYLGMYQFFYNCVSLKRVTLPYTGSISDRIRGIFENNASLEFIKIMHSSMTYWNYWSTLPSALTLVINTEQTWWGGDRNNSGVKSGWDVKYCDPDGAKLKVMINYEQAFELPYDEQSEWNVVMDAGQRLTTNEEHVALQAEKDALEDRVNNLEETLANIINHIDKRITLET